MRARATTTAPSRTTIRRSSSIPKRLPSPTPAAADAYSEQGRPRPRNPGLRQGDPTRSDKSKKCRCLYRPRHPLTCKGDYDRAIKDYDRAIQLDPKNVFAYRNRGIAYENKGDHDRAIQDYDRAIQLDPKDAVAYALRGILTRAKGDLIAPSRTSTRRFSSIQSISRLTPAAASLTRSRVTTTPPCRTLIKRSSSTQTMSAAYCDPRRRLRKQGRPRPRHPGLRPGDPTRSEGCHRLCQPRPRSTTSKGDHDRAIQDYDQAIQLDPKNAASYLKRGDAYESKGDHDRAIQDYDQAIQLDPKNAGVHNKRGRRLLLPRQLQGGSLSLSRANELEEDGYSVIWRYLARERGGENGTAELEADAARLKSEDWPFPVIELYLGSTLTRGYPSAR